MISENQYQPRWEWMRNSIASACIPLQLCPHMPECPACWCSPLTRSEAVAGGCSGPKKINEMIQTPTICETVSRPRLSASDLRCETEHWTETKWEENYGVASSHHQAGSPTWPQVLQPLGVNWENMIRLGTIFHLAHRVKVNFAKNSFLLSKVWTSTFSEAYLTVLY